MLEHELYHFCLLLPVEVDQEAVLDLSWQLDVDQLVEDVIHH
jgi:hypothetical protein